MEYVTHINEKIRRRERKRKIRIVQQTFKEFCVEIKQVVSISKMM